MVTDLLARLGIPVLIGILSDTHGQHLSTRHAMALFDDLGVEHVIHCGDVGGESVFDELVGRPCTFVWGNTDRRDGGLAAYLQIVGIVVPREVPTRIELDGKRIAVFHGHERGFQRAVDTLPVDYLLHGHSHVARNETRGGKRIINPGALYRARRKTVAVLDTTNDELTFYEIRDE